MRTQTTQAINKQSNSRSPEAGAQVRDDRLEVRRRQRCSLLRALRADKQLQQPDALLLYIQHGYGTLCVKATLAMLSGSQVSSRYTLLHYRHVYPRAMMLVLQLKIKRLQVCHVHAPCAQLVSPRTDPQYCM